MAALVDWLELYAECWERNPSIIHSFRQPACSEAFRNQLGSELEPVKGNVVMTLSFCTHRVDLGRRPVWSLHTSPLRRDARLTHDPQWEFWICDAVSDKFPIASRRDHEQEDHQDVAPRSRLMLPCTIARD